jgi:hypothetical protein
MNFPTKDNHDKGVIMVQKIVMIILTAMLLFAGSASAGNVNSVRARIVAKNWLTHVVHAYGSWGGNTSPEISDQESIEHKGVVVGYNFTINPKGHILVSARDDIPAVKLYSETSTLSLQKEDLQEQIEWVAEEIFEVGKAIDTHGIEMAAVEHSQNPDRKLWAMLQKDPREFERVAGEALTEAVSYGPLLTTTWAQGDPYNQQCPLWSTGCRTLVGCVATAASQIMKYWNYPGVGMGSKSYSWYNGAISVTLSRNFASSTYDWANMPNSVSASSTTTQKNAVSKLCADIGIAFSMDYGCSGSGAATSAAPNVFKTYFNYQSTATWVNRSSYPTASAWIQVFKAEVQAGRPSQLRIQDPVAGGHSVVVDGYRDSPSETVHINMGWSGSYDGWYTPDSFATGSFNWTGTSYQGAAIGIQPPSARVDFSKSDILWRNISSGENRVWYMDGVTIAGVDYIPTVPDINWSIAGVSDMNGDGKSDILWRHTSGVNYVWYMNGVTIAGGDYIPTVPDINWSIAGVNDINGDGKPDILWRHIPSGVNYVWYMNGVMIAGGDYIATEPDMNWTIVSH